MLIFFNEDVAVYFGRGDDDGIGAVFVDGADEDVSGLFFVFIRDSLVFCSEVISCMWSFSCSIFDKCGEVGVLCVFEVVGDGDGVLHNWYGMLDLCFVEKAGGELDESGQFGGSRVGR